MAGVVAHLADGDALALDYRSTPALVARGVDLTALLLEVLGAEGGLCGGRAGHMHLMSQPTSPAASGIVGAPGPLACGFGLAARHAGRGGGRGLLLRRRRGQRGDAHGGAQPGRGVAAAGRVRVQGQPVGGQHPQRRADRRGSAPPTAGVRGARGRGGRQGRVRGWTVPPAGRWPGAARRVRVPPCSWPRCARLEGHFLGDPLVRLTSALGELVAQVRPLVGQLRTQPGAPVAHRVGALSAIGRRAATLALERPGRGRQDPLRRAARRLPPGAAAVAARRAGRSSGRPAGARCGRAPCLGHVHDRHRPGACARDGPGRAGGRARGGRAHAAADRLRALRRRPRPRQPHQRVGAAGHRHGCRHGRSAPGRRDHVRRLPRRRARPAAQPCGEARGLHRGPVAGAPGGPGGVRGRLRRRGPARAGPVGPAGRHPRPGRRGALHPCRRRRTAARCDRGSRPRGVPRAQAAVRAVAGLPRRHQHATRSPSTSRQLVRTATSRTSRHRSRSGGRRRAARAATSP